MDQFFHDVGGGVIGKIRNNIKFYSQGTVVKLCRIAFNQFKRRSIAEPVLQILGKPRVQFDGGQRVGLLDQELGEDTLSRSDLYHRFSRLDICQFDYILRDAGIDEEVLPERPLLHCMDRVD